MEDPGDKRLSSWKGIVSLEYMAGCWLVDGPGDGADLVGIEELEVQVSTQREGEKRPLTQGRGTRADR